MKRVACLWLPHGALQQDRQALEKLAYSCERYSPLVGLEDADPPECLLLDVTGLSLLRIGSCAGEWGIVHQIDDELTAQGFVVRVAIGDSVGAAWAAAHFLSDSGKPVVLPAGELAMLFPLPLKGLRFSDTQINIFHRLGMRTIGEVLQLNRSTLPARFDSTVLQRIAQLKGEQAELFTACRPAPRFAANRSLEFGVTQTEVIEQLWMPLLSHIVGLLEARQLGTRHVQCQFISENKTCHDVALRMCEAVCDARQIGELLRLKLEDFRLDGPLIAMRLEALETAPLAWRQHTLFAGRSPWLAQQLVTFLNRLSSRLGNEAVARSLLRANPIPERAISWVPVIEKTVADSTQYMSFLPLDRPTHLFSRPQPVVVETTDPDSLPKVLFFQGERFEVAQRWGPERIETGWWQSRSIQREYYWIESTAGERFWLFRELRGNRWFVHGEFM